MKEKLRAIIQNYHPLITHDKKLKELRKSVINNKECNIVAFFFELVLALRFC